MEEYIHPVFGKLTDEEDIRIFKRQQLQEKYDKDYEKAMEEEYQRQCELESKDYEQYLYEVSQLEKYGTKNIISFEDWLKIKYKK